MALRTRPAPFGACPQALPKTPPHTLPLVGRAGEGEAPPRRPMSITQAQTLRAIPTTPEKALWRLLYPFRTSGFHFRKQAPIGPYYADIACHHAFLVIELDGDTHHTDQAKRHDATRDAFLKAEGYTVLRFSNADMMTNPEGVFDTIARTLEGRPQSHRSNRTPSPTLPTRGRVQSSADPTSKDAHS